MPASLAMWRIQTASCSAWSKIERAGPCRPNTTRNLTCSISTNSEIRRGKQGEKVTTQSVGIANHRFAFGYYRQTFWNWLIGTAFFLGGLGAGLFVLSLLTDHTTGMLAGYLIVVVG